VPEKSRAETAKPDPAPANTNSLPQIAAIKPAVPLPGAILPAPAPSPAAGAPALGTAKSMMGPPDPAAPRLLENAAKPVEPAKEQATNVSAAPAPSAAAAPLHDVAVAASADTRDKAVSSPKDQDKPVTEIDEATSNIRRTEFAVELGGANSIGGLRALWRGLLKSNNAELAELRPIMVLREGNTGLGMQLRLVAGPLPNAADAARICASLVESRRACETTVFDGQRLAMGADEQTPNGKPVQAPKSSTYSKRYYPKHSSKKDDPPATPKQEGSTSFSSLLGIGKR
jgi:hypothetical protein